MLPRLGGCPGGALELAAQGSAATGTTPQMNAPKGPSEMTDEDVLRVKLEVLRREHRDLDVRHRGAA